MAKKLDKLSKYSQGVFKKSKGFIETGKIKENITILPELKELIPPLKAEEYEQLEQNILKEGCREALLVWEREQEGDYILIDGHNRYQVCSNHQLEFKINLVHFKDMKEAREYMIDNQLGRRNLTPEQASYLRGMRYNDEKQQKGGYDKVISKAQSGPLTSERLAQEYNVSKNTIKRDAEYAAGLERIGKDNPELKQQILGGGIKVAKKDVQKLAKLDEDVVLKNPSDIVSALKVPEKKPVPKEEEEVLPELSSHCNKMIGLLKELPEKKADKAIVKKLKSEFDSLLAMLE